MKKCLIFVMCLAVAMCAALSGCSNNAVPAHDHTFAEEWSHTKDTHWHFCTFPGCNEHGSEESHDEYWELVSTTLEPQCWAPGRGTYRCTVCGQTKIDDIPPTEDHAWDEVWKVDAENNCHYQLCTVQGCTAVLREDHKPGNLELKEGAGSFSDGYSSCICMVCKTELERVIHPATGVPHSFELVFTRATGLPAGAPDPFIWFDLNDNMYHMVVADDNDGGSNGILYYYEFRNARTAADKVATIIPYGKELEAGMLIQYRSPYDYMSKEFLYGFSGSNIQAPNGIATESFIRLRGKGNKNIRFSFVYGGTTAATVKVTAYAEFVAEVVSPAEYASVVAARRAEHPEVDPARANICPSANIEEGDPEL